ncbi:uncharacterized protein FMAN_11094 [Fusarium mangiferae]|uniref:Uncharacterized protein n=1 Tax=Fusarium mangiferae TaxID=192010 RepID=A0A1L7TM74_FUSMA|nr:uncharacterized protein FMAN_11094 [Fusarium mangiferae]CVK96765.1 uncharacterized protein FMAN_11094 [Fusarium mangiferae]
MGATISSLMGAPKRPQFPTVPTDEVLPMHPFDDTPFMRKCPMLWTIRFDEILDADILNEALSKLFEMDGWRRLGGRIRLNDQGKAEVHIPKEYSAQRPAVHFTKATYDMPFADHPEASKLPTRSDGIAFFPNPADFQSVGIGPGAPTSFEDFCSTDAPQFSLHVATFQDGTLVSLTFMHMTTDLGGLSSVLEAWCSILAGKPEQIAKFSGYKDDVMAGLYRAETTEKSKTDGSLLSGWRLAVWALRAAYDGWMYPLESRMLRVPGKAINAIVAEARSEISLEKTTDGSKPFVSENDVILALFNRSVAQSMGRGRAIVTLIAVNPRDRLKNIFLPDSVYVQNAPCGAFFYCPVRDAQDLPLGKVAMLSRQAVVEYLTEGQIKAAAKAAYVSMIEGGNPPIVGDTTSTMIMSSNWAKSGFLDKTDFGPAVVGGRGAPARPNYYHMGKLTPIIFPVSVGINMGRDGDGNLWLGGDLSAASWATLMQYLKRYE